MVCSRGQPQECLWWSWSRAGQVVRMVGVSGCDVRSLHSTEGEKALKYRNHAELSDKVLVTESKRQEWRCQDVSPALSQRFHEPEYSYRQ